MTVYFLHPFLHKLWNTSHVEPLFYLKKDLESLRAPGKTHFLHGTLLYCRYNPFVPGVCGFWQRTLR